MKSGVMLALVLGLLASAALAFLRRVPRAGFALLVAAILTAGWHIYHNAPRREDYNLITGHRFDPDRPCDPFRIGDDFKTVQRKAQSLGIPFTAERISNLNDDRSGDLIAPGITTKICHVWTDGTYRGKVVRLDVEVLGEVRHKRPPN